MMHHNDFYEWNIDQIEYLSCWKQKNEIDISMWQDKFHYLSQSAMGSRLFYYCPSKNGLEMILLLFNGTQHRRDKWDS